MLNTPYTEYPFSIHPFMIALGIAKTKVRNIRPAPLPSEHAPKTRKNVCLLKRMMTANTSNSSRDGTSQNIFRNIQRKDNRGYLSFLAQYLDRELCGVRFLLIKT
jgi:hypothetical protein